MEFTGNINYREIGAVFASADVFLLPSFSDPSPLTVIEACKIGLPLLISDRCGNHFEAVELGYNGYVFDPSNREDVLEKFNAMLDAIHQWSDFSRRSVHIAAQKFDNEKV